MVNHVPSSLNIITICENIDTEPEVLFEKAIRQHSLLQQLEINPQSGRSYLLKSEDDESFSNAICIAQWNRELRDVTLTAQKDIVYKVLQSARYLLSLLWLENYT